MTAASAFVHQTAQHGHQHSLFPDCTVPLLLLQDAQRLFSFELDEIDMLDIDAAYEGAHQPTTDVYAWERGGSW
jgi:hypothetical protein